MAKVLSLVPCVSIFMSMILSSYAQTCAKYSFSSNKVFKSCNDLPVLNSFIHYNYDSTSGKLQIAYRRPGFTSNKWAAWAINPTSTGMVGCQALIAFQKSNGNMSVYTSPITDYQTRMQPGDLSFEVSDLSAEFANNEMIIYATVGLNNSFTTLNQVWQEGPVQGDSPRMHALSGPNIQSMGTLNLLSGQAGTTGGGNSKIRKANVHGVLNAVSWGVLMPIGAMFARYLKVFHSANPAWFYLHVTCQTSAYIVGVAGWATGMKLGSDSAGITYGLHRTIGIILFTLGTLQVFALLLRPKPDHKYRFYWNIYHHSIGYIVIILSIVNIFKGFRMLQPERKYENAYIGVIVALALNALWLEAYTWYIVMKRKKSSTDEKLPNGTNGANGVNGYGARGQYV